MTASVITRAAIICLLALPTLGLRAAVITWSGPTNITADANIITGGNFEYGGYYAAAAGTVTINGVTFTSSTNSVHLPSTTVTFNRTEFTDPMIGVGSGLSSSYQTLLGGRVYHSSATNVNTVTLKNLEVGRRYTVQVWIQDGRTWGFGRSSTVSGGGNTVVLDYNTTDAVGGRGQYCVGTFVADSMTQAITIQSDKLGQLNALQLRSLPPLTNVTVSVAATQTLRTVDSRMFSANTAIYDAQLHGPASVPLLFESDNQALRWPGGSYGDTFHQATEHLRPSYEPRTTNFLYIAKHTGAQLFMIANYGSGTPEEAADWVRYVNITNAAGAKYWEIANEVHGTWETDYNTNAPYRPHDGWTYAQRFADYYTQMKAVDPTIKIGAVGVPNETSYANGYTDHPAVNPRTGTTNYGWMPVVLATLNSLGVTPDFLVYHNYAGSGDAALLQWSTVLTRDGTNMQQMLADYIGPSAATNVELCITEIGGSGSDQSSTSLVGGLFLADNAGQALLSPFNARLWWSFRNGGSAVAANTNIYGWRNFQDYGQVPRTDSTALTSRYPTYYCAKLLQYWTRGGDTVVSATSESPLLSTYAVKRVSGELALLVINKSPDLTIHGTFSLAGFLAASNITVYSYGIPQDETVRTNGTLSPDIALTNFITPTSSVINRSFEPYSASVLVLGALDENVITKHFRTRITFPNYNRSEVLTNFPALVVLGTNVPGFSYDSFASSTAGDLRFKSADGLTDLNYEIERWNPRGLSLVWVQVPRFTTNVSILAQWGGTETTPPACTTNGATWTNGYVGVWHLNGLKALDSALANDATVNGTPTVLGRIGFGATFNNTANDTIQIPWSSGLNLANNFEISGWFKIAPGAKADFRTLTAKETSNSFTDRNWWLATRADGKLWWKSSVSSGTAIDLMSTNKDVCDGAWHHFSASHEGTTARLIVDGAQVAALTSPGNASTQTVPLQFGEELGAGRRLVGQLDEMRVSNVRRSTNWVWASYLTVASNATFSVAAKVSSINLVGTNVTAVTTGNSLQLSWPDDYIGWRLQAQTNSLAQGLGTNWVDVLNSAATNQITVPIVTTNGAVFYRMIYP